MINEKSFNKCDSIKIFEQIVKIPRPSGNEEKMVEFLMDFAKKYNLEYKLCGKNNIIIFKNATIKNSTKTLILQAHLDMVCEKEKNKKINFLKDEIVTQIDGDFISAKGTTLGADNGFGIALILHVLKSKNLKHCNLECVFTSQEETTMIGAKSLDYSLLTGKTILSLDGTSEQKIDSASASMTVVKLTKKIKTILNNNPKIKIDISNLIGGHSGEDINKDRTNAIKLLLSSIRNFGNNKICEFNGGNKFNAIPHEACLIMEKPKVDFINDTMFQVVMAGVNKEEKECVKLVISNVDKKFSMSNSETKTLIKIIKKLPHGVIKKRKNCVITSCNLAKIETNKNSINIYLSIRSSDNKRNLKTLNNLEKISTTYGYAFSIESVSPGFEENQNSRLIKLCKDTYKSLYNKEVIAAPVHAGLEGGVFYENIKNLDYCVIGCDLFNIHSPNEKASIASLTRVEKWVEKIIENF